MGAAQSIPVVGEIITVVDSSVKLVAAGSCALAGGILNDQDAKDAAKKFVENAGNSWVEYSERSLIVAPVRAAVHSADGNEAEAKRVLKKMGKSALDTLDNTPVLGHVKGVVHYAIGDTEHGHNCMKGASRTLVVVGAGALTGGVGGGFVLGGLAATTGGVVYDTTVSVIERKPYGIIESVDQVIESDKKRDGHGVINSAINVAYSVTGDFLTGAAAAKATKKLNQASKQRKALKGKIGKDAAKDVVDTGKKLDKVMKEVNGDDHVITKVKNLDTGEKAYGMNKRLNKELRMNEYASKGEASGYNSKTNAMKGHFDEFPRQEGILEKTANDMDMNIEPRVGNRAVNTCAEHHAMENLGTHGAEANIRTTTVTSHKGQITAIKRCDNCVQFDPLMGDVPTDGIHGMPVPTRQFVLDTSMPAIKSAATFAAGAFAVCVACEESDDCSCEKTQIQTGCTKIQA